MAYDIGSIIGDAFGARVADATPTTPTRDALRQHADGTSRANSAAHAAATEGDRSVLYWGAAIVLVALVALWYLGAFALKA